MVQVTMGNQDAVQAFKPQTRHHNLALRAFAAVDQEAVLIMHHDLRRKPAMYRWRRS